MCMLQCTELNGALAWYRTPSYFLNVFDILCFKHNFVCSNVWIMFWKFAKTKKMNNCENKLLRMNNVWVWKHFEWVTPHALSNEQNLLREQCFELALCLLHFIIQRLLGNTAFTTNQLNESAFFRFHSCENSYKIKLKLLVTVSLVYWEIVCISLRKS